MEAIMLIVVIFIAITVGGVFFMFKLLNKTNAQIEDNIDNGLSTVGPHPNSAQSVLPYDEVVGDMYKVGQSYRCVLKVNSINYALMTSFEQNALEGRFKAMLDSMDYVFAFYIQTRELNNQEMIGSFMQDYEKLKEGMPQCLSYANQFIQEFSKSNFDGVIVKNKYLILTSDENNNDSLSDVDKSKIAAEQLSQRVAVVSNGLRNIGLNAVLLKHDDLIELMVHAMNKNAGAYVNGISSGELTSDMTTGVIKEPETVRSVEMVLQEAETNLKTLHSQRKYADDADLLEILTHDLSMLKKKYLNNELNLINDSFKTEVCNNVDLLKAKEKKATKSSGKKQTQEPQDDYFELF